MTFSKSMRPYGTQKSIATKRRPRSEGRGRPNAFSCSPSGEKRKSSMTNIEICTDEELEQEMARVLAHARGEVLDDAEVQKFWQLHEEILRRREASGNAA